MYRDEILKIGEFIVKNNSTVREAATYFGFSKTKIHKLTEQIKTYDDNLYKEVRKVMEKNKAERHMRGGNATKKKWEMIKNK